MNKDREIRFGIVPPVPGTEMPHLLEHIKRSEDAGFDSVWFPDHMLFMADRITPEVWSVITAATQITSRIRMGAIGDPHRLHPAVFAHRLATIDNLSSGRIFTCLGYGEKMNLDPYGISWERPLARLSEAVPLVRRLWKGETVNYSGEFFSLSDAELRIKPAGDIPIYIAATGPRALRTAGETGDGWITNAMPHTLFSEKFKTVQKGFHMNKTASDFEKGIYIFLSVSSDPEEAYSRLDTIKHAIIWPELLKESGYGIEIDERYKGLEYTKIMPNDKEMTAKFREMGQKYYTREIVEDFVICGTKGQVLSRIEKYADAGVDHFILRDFSPDPVYSMDILSRSIIPYFRQ